MAHQHDTCPTMTSSIKNSSSSPILTMNVQFHRLLMVCIFSYIFICWTEFLFLPWVIFLCDIDVDWLLVCGLTGLLYLMSAFICCMQVWSRVRGRCCSPVWRGMIKGKSRWPSWLDLWLRCLHTITAKFVANFSLPCCFYLFLVLTDVAISVVCLMHWLTRNHTQQSWLKKHDSMILIYCFNWTEWKIYDKNFFVFFLQQALMMTIVNLAQNFVGSNNINILQPLGQFGTRINGGKDAASPRYIFTMLR